MIINAVAKKAASAGIKLIITLLKIFIVLSFSSLITKTEAIKGKKNTTGSQIKQIIGKTKKMQYRGRLLEQFEFEIFKRIRKLINTNVSFLARTSISAIGYNKKIGVKIDNTIIKFVGIFLKNL